MRYWKKSIAIVITSVVTLLESCGLHGLSETSAYVSENDTGSDLIMTENRTDSMTEADHIVHNDDMIWSWWIYPQVWSTEFYVYWGFTASDGGIGIAQYNIETGETRKKVFSYAFESDDHTGVSVTRMKDGKIMCAYTNGHNADDKKIHIMVSDKKDDISSFQHVEVISAKRTCYTQILSDKDNYYLFYRTGSKQWAMQYSSDGINWSGERVFVKAPIQYYCKFAPTTKKGVFRVIMHAQPNRGINADDIHDIRMGFFHTKNKKFYAADNKKVLGKANISYKKFSVLIPNHEGKRLRLLDIAVTPTSETRFLYADMSDEYADYLLYEDGESTKAAATYRYLKGNNYPGGACFVDRDVIAVSISDGKADTITLLSVEDKEVIAERVVANELIVNDMRLARPICDVKNKWLMWHAGYYNSGSFRDFHTSAELFYIPSKYKELPDESEVSTAGH